MEENINKKERSEDKCSISCLCKECSHFNVCALKGAFRDAEIAINDQRLAYSDIVEPFEVKCKFYLIEIIEKGINDKNPDVREAVLKACIGRDDILIEIVKNCLNDEYEEVREVARDYCVDYYLRHKGEKEQY